MSGAEVDLSQIRGDYTFHMNYLVNAIDQTLAREQKLWGELNADEADIEAALKRQTDIWAQLKGTSHEKSVIELTGSALEDFIEVSRSTKALCDAMEEAQGLGGSCYINDTATEQFTEACRQVRSLCDDLEMMREQLPAS